MKWKDFVVSVNVSMECNYFDNPDQEVIKNIVPSTNVDVFGEFYSILKDHIKKILI